ncbi:hypothetical protein B0T26DRAFT_236076 [Lasiosphaeria miniovina]|uniref:Secreted protein n=1 Tax=Lasiosphaeria miniovina TaxID=1954250 RepID=A0AA40AVP4_9PEZI|nr:uncharacterized protein B0T26DRAFT_236076 [Lasiosphaeria miniovina]KAK0722831.1 hypothetical protein B0T26DRAFT_236076 [Lasiosphaeria miniovina]
MLLARRRRPLGLLGQLLVLFGRGQGQPRNGEWEMDSVHTIKCALGGIPTKQLAWYPQSAHRMNRCCIWRPRGEWNRLSKVPYAARKAANATECTHLSHQLLTSGARVQYHSRACVSLSFCAALAVEAGGKVRGNGSRVSVPSWLALYA